MFLNINQQFILIGYLSVLKKLQPINTADNTKLQSHNDNAFIDAGTVVGGTHL